jgi:hypothetical protein
MKAIVFVKKTVLVKEMESRQRGLEQGREFAPQIREIRKYRAARV